MGMFVAGIDPLRNQATAEILFPSNQDASSCWHKYWGHSPACVSWQQREGTIQDLGQGLGRKGQSEEGKRATEGLKGWQISQARLSRILDFTDHLLHTRQWAKRFTYSALLEACDHLLPIWVMRKPRRGALPNNRVIANGFEFRSPEHRLLSTSCTV